MPHSPTENPVTATDAEVLTEQVWLLYRHFTFMSPANLPTVIIFSYILSRTPGRAMVLPWAPALTASVLLRVRLTQPFKEGATGPHADWILSPEGDQKHVAAGAALGGAAAVLDAISTAVDPTAPAPR